MGNWIYLVVIIVSGIIGYFTNLLAIKMLFHPYKEHRLFKIKIPFTPGIIPKNRHRIAVSLGEMMGENILKEEAIIEELNRSIESSNYLEGLLENKTIKELLGSQNDTTIHTISNKVSEVFVKKFLENNYAEILVEKILDAVKPKLGFFASMVGAFSKGLEDQLNDFVRQNAKEKISEMVEDELLKLTESNLNDLLNNLSIKGDTLINSVLVKASDKVLTNLISKIDFQKIIVEQIDNLEIKEFEQLILHVMKKELRAITYLGGFLGAILGAINIIFMML